MAWDQKRRPASEYIPAGKARRIIAVHHGVCHTCGHPDAEQVDHVIPWAEWVRTDLSPHYDGNLAPIHGAPCPTCATPCHQVKTAAESSRGRQRTQQARDAARRRPVEVHPGTLT